MIGTDPRGQARSPPYRRLRKQTRPIAANSLNVHRRTGGLEKYTANDGAGYLVHRRTGGLENANGYCNYQKSVHRRTGGLESEDNVNLNYFSCSPPYRRLRNWARRFLKAR